MKLQDALFNWLQIKLVAEARPEDKAARETFDFFCTILTEDHKLADFEVSRIDQTMYYIAYTENSTVKKQMFNRESAEQLLDDIKSNPKYNNQ